MSLFAKIFGREKENKETETSIARDENAVSVNTEVQPDDSEIVAVIMAALMNVLSVRSIDDLHIKSIRRVGRNSPAWNLAGRDEYIASKL